MPRTLLLIVLAIALVIELAITGGLFFAREATAKSFGVVLTADTSYLAYIIAWLCLFVSMMIVLAIWQLGQRDGHYAVLCYIMGAFWIGIGIGIYAGFGKPDNLFIDSIKGVLIVALTWWERSAATSRPNINQRQ